MPKTILHITIGILLSFCLSSCAIHQPMSEMVMFQKKKPLAGAPYYASYSHALASANTDHFLEGVLIDYTRKHYPEEEREIEYSNPLSLTTNLIFLNKDHKEIGFSLAIGPLLTGSGFDFTYNVFDHYYLTAAGGYGWEDGFQYQFIFQRRLLDGNPLGLAVGTVLRNRYRHMGIIVEYMGEEHIDFYTQSVGLRSVLTLSPISVYGTPRLFLYGTGSFNYDITLNAFYPKIGVSLGIY
ncbi:hypothetical protein [Gracilimonas mengyeensis]|uniref:Lipoprotein n=1 Tax=Gracilimonas mengyeensis TaxID=1302730 RepID=A0A521FF17_9BACT|nr:hypothetical protein [Gracilimonas mengyeensis]SMO94685.1 hypothetical protein SAMN06265219_1187 [Gracilimonas mengyeensis]